MRPILQAQGVPTPRRGSHWEIADRPRTATCSPRAPASCPDWSRERGVVYRRRRRSVCGQCGRIARQRGKSEPEERALTVEVWTSIGFSPVESVHQTRCCRLFGFAITKRPARRLRLAEAPNIVDKSNYMYAIVNIVGGGLWPTMALMHRWI